MTGTVIGLEAPLLVCGIDEAGRGPLAGPVYAAAVILADTHPIQGLRDSKLLSAAKREVLAEQIRGHAVAWAVASASVQEIDQLNILRATLLAMKRAQQALRPAATFALIDGNRGPDLDIPFRTIVKGDRLEPAISAASILAKTSRDAWMMKAAQQYPEYHFEQHKGYGTALHIQMLRRLGPCPEHRCSFAPVRLAHRARDVLQTGHEA